MGAISKLVFFLNVCFFCLGCVLLLPMLFHIHPYTVYSGSMEPVITTGSMIFVKENVPFAEIKENDIITFSMGKTIVTHRVEKVEKEAFITKGDKNKSSDLFKVYPENIKGRYLGSIPHLGYFVEILKTWKGILIWIVIILIQFIPRREKENESK